VRAGDERVAGYDAAGRVTGAAPRGAVFDGTRSCALHVLLDLLDEGAHRGGDGLGAGSGCSIAGGVGSFRGCPSSADIGGIGWRPVALSAGFRPAGLCAGVNPP